MIPKNKFNLLLNITMREQFVQIISNIVDSSSSGFSTDSTVVNRAYIYLWQNRIILFTKNAIFTNDAFIILE